MIHTTLFSWRFGLQLLQNSVTKLNKYGKLPFTFYQSTQHKWKMQTNVHNLTMEERNFCDEPKTMAVIHMLIHLALGNQYVKSAKKPRPA